MNVAKIRKVILKVTTGKTTDPFSAPAWHLGCSGCSMGGELRAGHGLQADTFQPEKLRTGRNPLHGILCHGILSLQFCASQMGIHCIVIRIIFNLTLYISIFQWLQFYCLAQTLA